MDNKQVDYKLFFIVFGLMIFGMIMISSVSVYSSFRVTSLLVEKGKLENPNNYFYVIRNIIQITISLFLLVFWVKIPYNFFEKNAKNIFTLNIFLLLFVLFFGTAFGGSKRWLFIPGIPFSIQPSEFLVFSVIIFFAYYFKKNINKISSFKEGYIPFLGILSIVFLLLALQPKFGAILIIGPITFGMYIISGAKLKHVFLTIIIGFLCSFFVYNLGKYDKNDLTTRTKLSYVTDRIDNFLINEKDLIKNKQINYQLEQGFISIGSGGFKGLGFGNSIQKFGYLPEAQGDFIFSIIIEELGFIGGLFLLLIYGYIGYRGFLISSMCVDIFAKLTSFGITFWILIQACINIGVNLGIVPLTGITLPFLSYGGSSILALTMGLGLLLNISRYIDDTKNHLKGSNKYFSRNKINLY